MMMNTSTAQSSNPMMSQLTLLKNSVGNLSNAHGLEVAHFIVSTSRGSYTEVAKVPKDRMFIITDVLCRDDAAVFYINLKSKNKKKYNILNWVFDVHHGYSVHLNSGLTCNPSDEIRIRTNAETVVSITGYFIDL